MKALIAVMCGLVLSSVAQARDVKPVRVIPITRESAAASALALASANSPLIGMPPVGVSSSL